MMSFWKPVLLLLGSRYKVARHALAQNPTASLWTLLLGGILALAALSMGSKVGARWSELTAQQAHDGLQRLWLLMQGFWLLALLVPGGLTLLGQTPPHTILRPFALRSSQTLIAETAAGVLDLPGLLALLLTLPLLCSLLREGQWAQALVTCVAFALIGLQTGVLARLLVFMGMLGGRRLRRLAQLPGMTALLLFLLCAGVPPAFASLTMPSPRHTPAWLTLPNILPSVPHFASGSAFGSGVRSFFPPNLFSANGVRALPASLAADAVVCTRRSDYTGAAGALGAMAAMLGITGLGTTLALRRTDRIWTENAGSVSKRAAPTQLSAVPAARTDVEARFEPLVQVCALLVTEGRLLLRNPQHYLPLRKPASLLLLSVFAFLAPNMSLVNQVYNLKEFLGVGILLYTLLWQVQFLCNRFGNEAGTGALLFGFSLPRPRLLVGKNCALLLLLLCLDSAATVGLSYAADALAHLALFLLWLPLILMVLTALGNVVSVLHPFAITRQDRNAGTEPPDNLAWIYIFVGCATGVLLVPVASLLAHGILGLIGTALYLGTLYILSLTVTTKLLSRNEHRMIAALDNNH